MLSSGERDCLRRSLVGEDSSQRQQLSNLFGEELNKIIDFYTSQPNPDSHLYSISIPGFDLLKEDFVPKEISPYQKYYEMFLDELLGGIVGHISKYSYYSSAHNVIYKDCNKEINKQFCSWARKFVGNDSSLRLYTSKQLKP
jgi:hypothetical protein